MSHHHAGDEPRDERGIIALVTAICMSLFLGVLIITVDVAYIRAERAHAQSAADNAALAAAWRSCKSQDDTAPAAARSVATDNGYPGVDVVSESAGVWRVTIDTGITGAFSGTLGVDSLDTQVTAVSRANCAPGTVKLPAAYASGECSDDKKAFVVSGNTNDFTGDVKSGHDMKLSGNAMRVYGDLYAGRDLEISAGPNAVTGVDSPDTVEIESGGGDVYYVRNQSIGRNLAYDSLNQLPAAPPHGWPVYWDQASFESGGAARTYAEAQGKLFTTLNPSGRVIQSGLYVLNQEKVVIDDHWKSAPGGVTIVTTHPKGNFVVQNQAELQPFFESLLLATWGTDGGPANCDYKGVDVTGNHTRLSGVLFAPNAQMSIQGNYHTVTGGMISRSVSISGNASKFISGTGGSLPTQFVQVME